MATYRELLAQRAQLDAQIVQIQAKERESIIIEILEKIRDYEIDLSDLSDTKQRGRPIGSATKKLPIIYRDPKSGKEWSGRGKPPNWIKGADNREKFKIKK